MINLKTDTDYLKRLAAEWREDGRNLTADDISGAAEDIEALKEYVERLKTDVDIIDAQLQSKYNQQKALSSALVAFMGDTLKTAMSEAFENSHILDELDDRIRQLEDSESDDDEVRAAVRSMISDGEIVVSIDHI